MIKRVFPIVDWLGNYHREWLPKDIFAGLTVGVMLIPQGMAYALIAGLPPVYGLYASIVPQIIYAFLGTSRQLSVAPVAMDSLLVAAGVGMLAAEGTETYIAFAILLATIMGAFQLLLGIFRLGFVTNLLSRPVISGFTSGAAVIIGMNQLKYLLGVELTKSNQVHQLVMHAAARLTEIHWLTFGIGVTGICIIKGIGKWQPRIPGALLAVIVGIGLVSVFRLHEQGVDIVQTIPSGLPVLQWPNMTLGRWGELFPLAMTLAVVAFMEAFSVSKAIEAKRRNYRLRPSQELIALGAANVIGSLFQSFPVTGGFSRSAVNEQSNAQTPLAAIISALLVALTLMFLTPLFYHLPKAILASVIMVAVYGLIDVKYARFLLNNGKVEFTLLLITFLVTISWSMIPGIVTGIVLSILILLYKAAYPHLAELGRLKDHHEFRNIRRFEDLEQWEELLILRVDAPFTFINIQYIRDAINKALQRKPSTHTVILDGGPVNHLDATATEGLKDLLRSLKERNISVLFCDFIGPVRDVMQRSGLAENIGEEHIFIDLNEAVRYATTQDKGRFKAYALQANVQ